MFQVGLTYCKKPFFTIVRLIFVLFLTNSLLFLDVALETFITEVVQASNRGVSAVRNATSEPNWSFGQSLFFSSTVITTIGKQVMIITCNMMSNFCFYRTAHIRYFKNGLQKIIWDI